MPFSRLQPLLSIRTLLAGVIALHLLQLLSPIRVNTDAVRLLDMAWTKAETGVLPPEQFPPLYPTIVTGMIHVGLDNGIWLGGLNYLAFGAGLLAWATVARRTAGWTPARACAGAVLMLTSWVLVKHALIPLTEPLYFAIANGSLYAAVRATEVDNPAPLRWWTVALVLAALAVLTRTIGVALLLALALTMGRCWCGKRNLRELTPVGTPRNAGWFIGVAVLLGAALVAWLVKSQLARPDTYLNSWISMVDRGSAADAISLALTRLRELGSLTINLPLKSGGIVAFAATAIGAGVAWVLVLRFWRARSNFGPVLAYVLFYCGILAVWPYDDPRFWLPVLPWMLLVIAPQRDAGMPPAFPRPLPRVALALYLAGGIAALGYSTRLTFAGRNFATRYTHGSLRASYEAAFHLPATVTEAPDPQATEVLRHYAPCAALSGAGPAAR